MSEYKSIDDNWLNKIIGNKRAFNTLSSLAKQIKSQELIDDLAKIKEKYFKDSEEVAAIKEKVESTRNALGMVKLNIPLDTVYIIMQTIKCHEEKGGSFSLRDSTKIIYDAEKLYGDEQADN